ncbi:MAG: phosphodiesterase [Nocardioidaceae bacterium]|nr:phosphodiesterase [Nocardioidaceae bacterium]
MTDRTPELRAAIEQSGYYPVVVTDAVLAAVAGEPAIAHLVHHEPTIDERDEVRRHMTVLVLTPSRLVLTHTDEHAPDDMLPEPYTSTSTEAVTLSAVRSVVVNRIVANPASYGGGPIAPPGANEAVLTVGWGAVGRIDLEPAGCGDPDCEADHGYTGVLSSDDFSLRVSAAAEGPEAVANLLDFADTLSARTGSGIPVR